MFWAALGVELLFGGLLTYGLWRLTIPATRIPVRVPRVAVDTITSDSDYAGMV